MSSQPPSAPSSPILIRPARLVEFDRLAEIGLAAWERGIRPLVPAPAWQRMRLANPFLCFLRQRGDTVLVADRGGEPVGIAARDGDYISDLWVAPLHEGCGVGSTLLATLEEAIARTGHAQARIDVLSTNRRALALYRHRGYRPAWQGVRRDYALRVDLHKTGLIKVFAPA